MRRLTGCLGVRRIAMCALALGAVAIGCSDGSDDAATDSAATDSATTDRCLLRLHGKGGAGAETVIEDDISVVSPDGNSEGWGARQWLYFPDDDYVAARTVVEDAITGCDQVIINGFSNGGAFAAKLYCRGETFGGRVVGVVVDDPVVDAAVEACAPDPLVDVTLYWTGALEAQAQPGWDCSEADWTCEGGRTIGIDAYAEALRTQAQASPFEDHQWFLDAPELSDWR
jgi:pimeloyl-ACP methyl ester carboxylesterase